MRLPTLLNWMLLTVNVLTFAFLLCFPCLLATAIRIIRAALQADANVMGWMSFADSVLQSVWRRISQAAARYVHSVRSANFPLDTTR